MGTRRVKLKAPWCAADEVADVPAFAAQNGEQRVDKTLLKGLSVLEALAELDVGTISVDDIAQRVGLSRSNAYRTLQTLVHAGYVARDDVNGGYFCTTRMYELGALRISKLDVRRLAPPYLSRLAEDAGETVHLSILDGFEIIYIDKIDSAQPIRAYSLVGGRAPAHAVATGKALLSVQPLGLIDKHGPKFPRFTDATITALSDLKAELARAARQGYAVNRGEWRDGVGGLAAAVFDATGQSVAALGISGPLARLTGARMKALAPRVVALAQDLSRALGYAGTATKT
jgi:DNA-binding IclR family transcriptional regulator